ncbi:hypothetical protein [Clostridium tertium]|uniref:hypothetical protein n=1 Tax=Clostridium tertium TaxID=1559 RepID=UPI00374F6ACF
MRNDKEMKFENNFKNYKKVIIVTNEKKVVVKNYREFLEGILLESDDTIEELEEFFVSFIKFIAIINEVIVEVFDKSTKGIREKNTEKLKRLYLDDFESIINIIEELNLARVLIVYEEIENYKVNDIAQNKKA